MNKGVKHLYMSHHKSVSPQNAKLTLALRYSHKHERCKCLCSKM